ncbi:hypothetical protein CWI38_1483p0010, partial [Hamiltosporidium tvaerminnensis]
MISYVMAWNAIVTKYHNSYLKRLQIPITLEKTVETIFFDRRGGPESRPKRQSIRGTNIPLKKWIYKEDGVNHIQTKNNTSLILDREPTIIINEKSNMRKKRWWYKRYKKMHKSKKTILPFKNEIVDIILDSNGYAYKNQITAVISYDDEEIQSFMALLSGEIENNEWTKGIIKADGTYREDNDWIKNFIFCKNTNVFLPYITVNDAIKFCFLFKGNHISSLEEIEETLKLFKLFRIRNNKIEQLSESETNRLFLARIYILEQKVVFISNVFKSSLSNKRSRNLFCKILRQVSKTKTVFLGLNKFHREIYSIIDSIVILNKGRTVFSGTKKSYIEFLKKYNIELSGKKFRNLEFLSQLSIQ